MALRVEDVDLAAGVIHVRRGWDVARGRDPTEDGKERRVPIAAVLRDYLDEHLLALGRADGLVFGVSAASPFVTVAARASARDGGVAAGQALRRRSGCTSAGTRSRA